ncbi:hypothetical protein BZG01_18075 [Labilibaculum manganireducens]|uniref:Grasp-with-spasm system SPASM domain peptide maturase n=1 Tax=Labilibaculum manganireducens TaxID=1940525 RepID=A0A2N3HVN5_9BACT|nr:hypothetical protein [Labilibaculum manganireducens]PKQ62135.1 hypothetical protein BZG01_18075 [Labilibaculum manganireducens]
MCSKYRFFVLFQFIYVKKIENRIFLYNTFTNNKYEILEPEIIKNFEISLKLYNAAFQINKINTAYCQNLVNEGFGEIIEDEKDLFIPLRSCLKIENNKSIIQRDEPLIILKQLLSNVLEFSFIMSDIYNKSQHERQYFFSCDNLEDDSNRIFDKIKYLLNNDNLFPRLQSVNIYTKKIEEIELILGLIKNRNIIRFHIPIELYLSARVAFNEYNTTVYLERKDELESIGDLLNNHRYVICIEDVNSIVPYNSLITYKPRFKDNLVFFQDNIFLSEYDIVNQKHKVHEIIKNGVINSYDFGKIFIDIKGNYGTNMFSESIGNFFENDIKDNFLECYKSNESTWFLTRSKVEPCSNCNYCDLCPPISGLEFILDKFNLCQEIN